jgi:hypothetical protein
MKKTPYSSRATYKKEILGDLRKLWKDQTQIIFTLTWRLVTEITKEAIVHWTIRPQQKSFDFSVRPLYRLMERP